MAWTWLFLAGLTEVGWAVGLKYAAGFTRPLASAWTLANMVLSFVLLSQALKSLPLGTAYAAWTGIGAVGTALLGILLFAEPAAWPRLACIGLIVAGVVGLRVLTPVG
jgi:quaternary ammonium compound-resistance protein SugE